jgi:hypothetical protein
MVEIEYTSITLRFDAWSLLLLLSAGVLFIRSGRRGRSARPAESEPTAAGAFVAPAAGSRLSRDARFEVELTDVPVGYRVWLAVERDGRYWPQEPDIPWFVERWSGPLPGVARGETFSLSLWLVLPCEHLRIRNWLVRPDDARHSGMSAMPGLRLAAVGGLWMPN